MIVRCGACAKRYHLDDTVLGSAGKKVRCTACEHVWHQPPPPPSVNTLMPLPQVSPTSGSYARRSPLLWAGSILLIALSTVAGLWLYVQHQTQSWSWPFFKNTATSVHSQPEMQDISLYQSQRSQLPEKMRVFDGS